MLHGSPSQTPMFSFYVMLQVGWTISLQIAFITWVSDLCKKGISSEIYQMYHMDTAHAERAEYFNCRFCYWNT